MGKDGYSSLAVALVLPDSGFLVACERDANSLEVALRYYKEAGVLHKVCPLHGLAKDALNSLLLNGEAGSYDFAFIDADKKMYGEYFELLLQLVRVGGLIVIDNVLWHGKIADPLVTDSKTMALREFNTALLEDHRVDTSMANRRPNIHLPSDDRVLANLAVSRLSVQFEAGNFMNSRRSRGSDRDRPRANSGSWNSSLRLQKVLSLGF
ncbi:hypothetical protein Droror1_Dr00020114, partial [Drosera rotundifolia]